MRTAEGHIEKKNIFLFTLATSEWIGCGLPNRQYKYAANCSPHISFLNFSVIAVQLFRRFCTQEGFGDIGLLLSD